MGRYSTQESIAVLAGIGNALLRWIKLFQYRRHENCTVERAQTHHEVMIHFGLGWGAIVADGTLNATLFNDDFDCLRGPVI